MMVGKTPRSRHITSPPPRRTGWELANENVRETQVTMPETEIRIVVTVIEEREQLDVNIEGRRPTWP